MRTATFSTHGQSLLTLLLLVAAGAFGDVAVRNVRSARDIGQLLPLSTTPRHTAFLVMRPADCDGNLDVLDLFRRQAIRERVTFGGIVILGSNVLSDDASHLLRTRRISARVMRADDDLQRRLGEFGWRATPFLLVVGHDGSMRAALSAPQSIPAYLAFASALQTLPKPEGQ
jgi:hypothetical protein